MLAHASRCVSRMQAHLCPARRATYNGLHADSYRLKCGDKYNGCKVKYIYLQNAECLRRGDKTDNEVTKLTLGDDTVSFVSSSEATPKRSAQVGHRRKMTQIKTDTETEKREPRPCSCAGMARCSVV